MTLSGDDKVALASAILTRAATDTDFLQLTIPGESWEFDFGYQTRWAMGYPSRSISWYLRRDAPDPNDPDQLHIEVRVFLDEPRATVFAEVGQRWFGKNRPLLTDTFRIHPRAPSYEELHDRIVTSVCSALLAYREALESVRTAQLLRAA